MPQPHRVPAIRDDNDPVSASGKQSVCCPKGTGGSGQLPGGVSLAEDGGEGRWGGGRGGRGSEEENPSASAVTLPIPHPQEVLDWGKWEEDRAAGSTGGARGNMPGKR